MSLKKMEKDEFLQVRGELTGSIVKDFKENLERCLQIISLEPCFDNSITTAEAYFIVENAHLGFFDPQQAIKMADQYNFLELKKSSPEQMSGIVRKLLIPREKDANFVNQPELVLASRYFFRKINGIVMNKNYTSRIEAYDEIYLKLLQALHSSSPNIASLNAQTYNIIQEEAREKCRSRAKLKQISRLDTQLGYGIVLE